MAAGHFSAHLKRVFKTRWRGGLWLDLVMPILFMFALGAIKQATNVVDAGPKDYSQSAFATPTMTNLLEAPDLSNPSGSQGSWYLRNWAKFDSFRGNNGFVSNIAYWCAGDFGFFQNETGFASLCEATKILVLPQDRSDAAQVAAADAFRAHWLATEPLLSSQERMDLGEFAEEVTDVATLESYVKTTTAQSGKPRIGLAVVFTSGAPSWSYTLHVDRYAVLESVNALPTADLRRSYTSFSDKYIMSGFNTAQMAVDEYIVGLAAGDTNNLTKLSTSSFPFPTEAYEEDEFWANAGDNVMFFLLLAAVIPLSGLSKSIIMDKETQWKELLISMGLSPSAYILSWLAFAIVQFSFTAILVTVFSGSLFPKSEKSLMFALFFSFFMAAMGYGFLMATLFSRASIGNIITIMTFFGMDNLRAPVASSNDLSVLSIASLLPPVGLGLTINTIGEYERNVQGVSWADPGLGATNGYSVTRGIALLLFDASFYLSIAFMVEFLAGGSGRQLLQRYKKRNNPPSVGVNNGVGDEYLAACDAQDKAEAKQAESGNGMFEILSQAQRDLRRAGKCVMISDLHKTFGAGTSKEIRAVNGLTTTFFENEISVLLGHNGAGKSTTDAMLTGLISPTSGSIYIDGKSVESEIRDIRHSLGLCPQKNVMLDTLTVKEHLDLMAVIKGIPKSERENAVRNIIAEVSLSPKTNTRSKALSGGMKRKLQLAMSLIGDNKIVIIDEATSGMDTHSRTATQRCIQRHREGRVIILTTHYMDEADVLGDRVVVMNKGSAQCSGSTLFLKKALGVGYQLVVQTEKSGSTQKAIVKSVKSHVSQAEEADNSSTGNEVVIQLPLSSSSAFEKMLRSLENDDSLGIVSTGISVTTLESVFLRLAENAEGEGGGGGEQKNGKALAVAPAAAQSFRDLEDDDIIDQDDNMVFNPPGALAQFVPLFLKRSQTARRDRRAWCCQLVTPLVFMLLGFFALNIDLAEDDLGYEINAKTDGWNTITKLDTPVPSNAGEGLSKSPADTAAWMDQFIIPRVDSSQVFDSIGPTSAYCRNPDDLSQSITSSIAKLGQQILRSSKTPGVALPSDPPSLAALVFGLTASESPCSPSLDYNETTQAFSDALRASRSQTAGSRYGAALFNVIPDLAPAATAANGVQADFTVAYNFTGIYAMPVMLNRLSEALLRQLDDTLSISLTAKTLPQSQDEETVLSGFAALLAGLCLTIAFAFVSAGFMLFIVREKENKAWHQQLINGVNPWAYWASNLVFDYAIFLINFGAALALVYVFDVTVFKEEIGAFALLFLLFGLAITPFTFCFSFLFNKAPTAQLFMIFFNLIGGVVLGLASFILSLINEDTQALNDSLAFVFRLFPSFCLSHGLISTANKLLLGFVLNARAAEDTPEGETFVFKEYTALDLEIAGWDCVFLAGEAVLFTLLLALLQIKVRSGVCMPSFNCCSKSGDNDKSSVSNGVVLEDQDVLDEKERAKTVDPSQEAIVLRSIRKQYSNGKVAVKDVGLGVHRNEVFSLLGTNGAGKTTTFGMLSGEFYPSSGSVFVDGINVVDDPIAAQSSFGFCPQFDALFELLSGRECLEFYARMKGVPSTAIARVVNGQIQKFGLGPHADRLSGTYSGGNKRKLSVAQATLGAPKVVILDEPSAGLDVAARHALHAAIARQAKRSTVVLTTHSMEECEALSDRIAIMVDGRLRCIGTAQRLKTLYGSGYQLDTTLRLPTDDEVATEIADLQAQDASTRMTKEQVYDAVKAAGVDVEAELKTPGGSGVILQDQLVGLGYVTAESLANYLFSERGFLKTKTVLTNKFPGTQLLERLGTRARFTVPFQKGVKLSSMFGAIEAERASIGIESYSLGQTSLEMIFNNFAATQSDFVDE